MTVNLTNTNGAQIAPATIEQICSLMYGTTDTIAALTDYISQDQRRDSISSSTIHNPDELKNACIKYGRTITPDTFGALTTVPFAKTDSGLVSLVFFEGEIAPHAHPGTTADIFIIDGNGRYQLADAQSQYTAQSQIHVPNGVVHGFRAQTPTLMLARESNGSIVQADGSLSDTVFTTKNATDAYNNAIQKYR